MDFQVLSWLCMITVYYQIYVNAAKYNNKLFTQIFCDALLFSKKIFGI